MGITNTSHWRTISHRSSHRTPASQPASQRRLRKVANALCWADVDLSLGVCAFIAFIYLFILFVRRAATSARSTTVGAAWVAQSTNMGTWPAFGDELAANINREGLGLRFPLFLPFQNWPLAYLAIINYIKWYTFPLPPLLYSTSKR